MLESILIIIIAMGFVLFVLGIELESITYSATSILMWIIVLAGQIYIEVPTAADTYSEMAIFGVALAFIFINVIWIVLRYMENQFEGNIRP